MNWAALFKAFGIMFVFLMICIGVFLFLEWLISLGTLGLILSLIILGGTIFGIGVWHWYGEFTDNKT